MALRRARARDARLMRKRAYLLILVVFLLLLSASMAFPQAETRIRIIAASNVGSAIDPSLRDVHDQLGSLFNFTSYRLLRDETLSLSLGRTLEIPLHKERSMEITLMSQRRDMAEIKVRIKREGTDILNTQVRLSPGRTVLIGGPKHREGVIILALSARF